jgi:hypothetical protein
MPSEYDSIDTPGLVNLLMNPNSRPEVHRAALSALSRRNPRERTPRLLDVLKVVIANPKPYDQQVMTSAIDILATDPDASATEAMIEMLPSLLEAFEKNTGLSSEFREYFFEALVTRRREDDLDVWRIELPKLNSDTLVSMLYDPAAKSLKSIDPFRLITKLPSQERSTALRNVFFRSLFSNPGFAFEVLSYLLNSKQIAPPSKRN